VTPAPSRRPGGDRPSRRAPVDKVVGCCSHLARLLAVGQETSDAGDAAFDLPMRRGISVPSDTAVRYVAVETDANRQATCVVGVFRSPRSAEAFAQAAGWADHQVAPYRLHPSWLTPGNCDTRQL
jgi:hypothetical protein